MKFNLFKSAALLFSLVFISCQQGDVTNFPAQQSSSSVVQSQNFKPNTKRYENVVAGRVSEEDYVEHLANTMSELIAAKDNGWILGIHYNPNKQERRELAKEYVLQSRSRDNPQFEREVEKIISEMEESKELYNASTSYFSEDIGKNYAVSIAVWPSFFETPLIVRETDARSVVKHEIEHARFFYGGSTTLRRLIGSFSADFKKRLLEIDPVSVEVSGILEAPDDFSEEYHTRVFNNFLHNLPCPENDVEENAETLVPKNEGFEISTNGTIRYQSSVTARNIATGVEVTTRYTLLTPPLCPVQ